MADYNSDRTGSNIDAVLDKADNLTQAAVGVGGNVGIGTASPATALHTVGDITLGTSGNINSANAKIGALNFYNSDTSGSGANNSAIIKAFTNTSTGAGGYLTLHTSIGGEAEGSDATERARIDSSGNLLVGTTDLTVFNNSTGSGFVVGSNGQLQVASTFTPSYFNRQGSDGNITSFYKDGATVGSISSRSGNFALESGDVGLHIDSGIDSVYPSNGTGSVKNGAVDLGFSGARFKDLYLSGGVYLGGTSADNKLDDYEEGVWTPVLGGLGSTSGQTYTTKVGYYTKVGNTVTARFLCQLSNKGTLTGAAIISGLPFPNNARSDDRGGMTVVNSANLGLDTVNLATTVLSGTSYARIGNQLSASSDPNFNVTADSLYTDTTVFSAVIIYTTN